MSPQIFRALTKHQQLDCALQIERSRAAPNAFRVQQLKKMKLAIKDRLNALSTGGRQNALA